MKPRFARFLGILFVAALSCGAIQPAAATNLNTHATQCQPEASSQGSSFFRVTTSGPMNAADGLTSKSSANLFLVCSIPRSPLASTATSGSFFIDGDNNNPNGWATTCVLASYNYNGTILGTSSASSAAAHFDLSVSLPATQLSFYAYTNVFCSLAPGSILRGVTAVQ